MQDKAQSDKDKKPGKAPNIPPAGPHAKPGLTDEEKTPGTGALPDPDAKEIDPGGD